MRNYSLTFKNPYNEKIAKKLQSYQLMKNQVGEPEMFSNNIPQSLKTLSGGAIRVSSKEKMQLNKLLQRKKRGGAVQTGSAVDMVQGTPANGYPTCSEMDEKQPLKRPGLFIIPVQNTNPKVLSYQTPSTNAPYYNQVELNKINTLRTKFKDDNILPFNVEKKVEQKEKEGGAMVIPSRKIGGKRYKNVAGIGVYKGGMTPMGELEAGFSFSGIGKAISSAVKKIPSLIRKGAPKLAKSALKFMKGTEGQKVIGNVLSEVGTQAVKKIFEAPPALQDEEVLGSGIKVDINRDDIVDGKMKDAFDKLVVNGELRKDRLPLVRRIMKKSGMGATKKEMTGGIIPIILGIIGAVAAAAGATHSIVSAENERAKGDRVNQIRQSQELAEQIAERYIQRKKEKGEEVDMKTDPIIRKLKRKRKDLELEAKKLGGSMTMSDVIDKMVDALMQGAELKTGSGRGKSMAKKGLEPKKEKKPTPQKEGGNLGLLFAMPKLMAKMALKAEDKKKGGASIPDKNEKVGGKRKVSDKMKKRAELVRKIMKERGVKLAEASKIIKKEGLL